MSFIDQLSDADVDEIQITIDDMAQEHLKEFGCNMMKVDFMDEMVEEIAHVLFQSFLDSDTCGPDDYDEIALMVEENIVLLYDYRGIPERSIFHYDAEPNIRPSLIEKVRALQSVEQPVQRSAEWYEERHSIITASNIWKVFASDAQYNSFIYDKCQTTGGEGESRSSNNVNTSSPLHWGVKYEPLTVMLYESRYKTRVGMFGCMKHPKYTFIGASPDGINVDESSPLYGRMVEIKNIVNREITGIPSDAYWVQMQIQMEVCDLDGCDFAETRFKEYESEEAFYQDETNQRGIILHFISNQLSDDGSNPPIYHYMPLDSPVDKETIDAWIQSKRTELRGELVLFQTLYWYLDEFSCVYVPRNRIWFEYSVPKLKEVWATILKEREEGYEHRAPKNRTKSLDDVLCSTTKSVCLIKLDSTDM